MLANRIGHDFRLWAEKQGRLSKHIHFPVSGNTLWQMNDPASMGPSA